MGIIMGALAGAGKAAGEVADANTKLWGQQELAAQQAEITAMRDAALAQMQEQSSIRSEERGLVNQARSRAAITEEGIANAPRLRQVKTDDAKAAKLVEFDPEIQSLMRKAENEKLTSAEQAKLDFYKANKDAIIGEKRDMARAGNIDNGAGLRAIQIEDANLTLTEKKKVKALMEEYETTKDPARKMAIKEALTTRGVLKSNSEFDTEKVTTEVMNPDGTTSKTERAQKRKAGDAKLQDVTYIGKVIGQAATSQEASEMVARLRAGGAAQNTSTTSVVQGRELYNTPINELKRMATKPKGVSSSEASAAQAELDSRKGESRIGSF